MRGNLEQINALIIINFTKESVCPIVLFAKSTQSKTTSHGAATLCDFLFSNMQNMVCLSQVTLHVLLHMVGL